MLQNDNVTNYHVQYIDISTQYWHPESEEYAGGDHLTTALYHGWEIVKCVETKRWYAGMRFVRIFQFELSKGENTMVMPVIHNPYVERFTREEGIEIIKEESEPA